MPAEQLSLQFGPIHNAGLFSNHWLTHRLVKEPEWRETDSALEQLIEDLEQLWTVQRERVEHYGDEQDLEEAFIQPVLRALGWKLKYQTYLRGREPDYGLFLDDLAIDAALNAGRNEPRFWEYPSVVADAKAWHLNLNELGGSIALACCV